MMLRLSLFLAGLLSCHSLLAAIDVLPKLIAVQGDKPAKLTVINHSDHAEFVMVSLSRLLNPGVPWQQERLEAVGVSRRPALYAFPFRLSLAPGQSKTVALQPLAAVEKETVWRLEVSPVTALAGKTSPVLAAGVAVNLRFSVLVRQLPEKQTQSLGTTCAADRVILTATGTTRSAVNGLRIDHRLVSDFHLYPGVPATFSGQQAVLNGKNLCP